MKKLLWILSCVVALLLVPCTVNAAEADFSQKVIRQGDDVYISFRYQDNMDMHLNIGKCGVNGIPNIKRIFLDYNRTGEVSPWITEYSSLFMEADTDWVGPYMVKVLSSREGMGVAYFTGGWHGINPNGSGKASGRNEAFRVYINNEEIKNDELYEGEVRIVAINRLRGYNTVYSGIDAIEEHVEYIIDRGTVKVNVTAIALEDISIMKYYGMQSQNNSWNGKLEYGNGTAGNHDKNSDSGLKRDKKVANSYTLTSKDEKFKLSCRLDASIGLGTFEGLPGYLPTIFTVSYGNQDKTKTYFNLINGAEKRLNKGQWIKWSGEYEFK